VQTVAYVAGRSPLRFSLAMLAKIRGTTASYVFCGSRGFSLAKPKLSTPHLPPLPPFPPKKITLSYGKKKKALRLSRGLYSLFSLRKK
jgi:hypothetical protein